MPLSGSDQTRQVVKFAWRRRRSQIVTLGLGLVLLLVGATFLKSLQPPLLNREPTSAIGSVPEDLIRWLENLQIFVGFFTLLVATFVWYGELREDWEEELPCLMSAYFFYNRRPVIVCRHIWLAGPSDLRAWAQQVGAQAARVRFLEFTPDVKARHPEIVRLPDGSICRHYAVRFHLTNWPPAGSEKTSAAEENSDACVYQNLLAQGARVRLESVATVEALPDVQAWKANHEA